MFSLGSQVASVFCLPPRRSPAPHLGVCPALSSSPPTSVLDANAPFLPRGAHCSPSYVLMAWQRRSFAEPPCSMGTFTLSYGIAGRWPGLTLVSSPLLYFLTLPRSLFHLLWPGPSHPDAGPGGCPGRSSS